MNPSKYVDEKIISREEKTYTIIIIYDITDNKRRNRMAKFLEGYGVRVQKSAFEARLTKMRYAAMLRRAERIIDNETDSLRTYLLPSNSLINSYGTTTDYPQNVIIV